MLLGPPFNRGTCARPAKPAQIDALNGDEDIVTVGIGGNTLGFATILAKCREMGVEPGDPPSPGPGCSGYYENGEGRQWLADKFATLTRARRRRTPRRRHRSACASAALQRADTGLYPLLQMLGRF
ncbi:hypothetical protein [Nonomuraea sp. NPDC049750]|uniref:hypothetical protein n=1 Tax=Nonomuraea sp. NPDC049750 TaxID=3154738 RepID=UPI0033DCDE7F